MGLRKNHAHYTAQHPLRAIHRYWQGKTGLLHFRHPKKDDLFELQRDYSCFDFTRLEDCQKVLHHCDNNNGALVLCIKERGDIYRLQDVKYGFLLGPEDLPHDETPFSRWVTLEEYLTRQPRYEEIDIFFARIFNQMMQFFNAKSISNAL